MKNVIILGGSGYIGTHLIEIWSQSNLSIKFFSISRNGKPSNLSKSLIDNKNIQWISDDIFNIDSYISKLPSKADYIIDLIGTASAKDTDTFKMLNVEPVNIMIKLMDNLYIPKGCYVSGLIGMPRTNKMFIESKHKGEDIAKNSQKNIGIIRPSLVYGNRPGVGIMVIFVSIFALFNKELKPVKIDQLVSQIISLSE